MIVISVNVADWYICHFSTRWLIKEYSDSYLSFNLQNTELFRGMANFAEELQTLPEKNGERLDAVHWLDKILNINTPTIW